MTGRVDARKKGMVNETLSSSGHGRRVATRGRVHTEGA